ncbi:S8 family serine peptidase [bacterium]|nr:S8 family serine peptidase [bacterium]
MGRIFQNLSAVISFSMILVIAGDFYSSLLASEDDSISKISRSLLYSQSYAKRDAIVKAWIFFNEISESIRSAKNETSISMRAVRRIQTRTSLQEALYSFKEVPDNYIEILKPLVVKIRFESRYFDAISVEAHFDKLLVISNYHFVRSIEPVISFKRGGEFATKDNPGLFSGVSTHSGNPLFGKYGASLGQLDMIEAAQLLECGYNGSGVKRGHAPVLVCLLDSGFDLSHEAFKEINIIAERDFIQNDSITANEPGDTIVQDEHGTIVLGTLAGYHEGDLIGPAWGADFILAKTENLKFEKQIEEDTWIKGLEWADSAGADIVSSSLGYSDWYIKEDFDGETALCTRAADLAASRGIVIVNAMGNNGWMGATTLIAPADADSIIAVGSVDKYQMIAWSSSHGPTADGRIKPEVVAQGVGVHTVDPGTSDGYAQFSGTSLATPLVAGLCAQLLDLNPALSIMELRNVLMSTATRNENPDNSYGYGIVQGLKASGLESSEYSENATITGFGPNPFSIYIHFELFLPDWVDVSVRVFDCRGALVRTLVDEAMLKLSWEIEWDGRNDEGKKLSAGIYLLSICYGDLRETRKVVFIP